MLIIPFLSQASSRVGESSDAFSQGATAAVPYSVDTTVISELVVTSTLLLSADAEPETLPDGLLTLMYSYISILPTISPFVAPSKDSTDFSLLEEGREAESEGAPGVPQSFPSQGIEFTTAGMLCCLGYHVIP